MTRFAPLAALVLAACGSPVAPAQDDLGMELVDQATADQDETEALKADSVGLTAAQAKNVLEALNNICGDTWCEGDYTWDFKKIVCTFGLRRCTITVLATSYDTPPKSWWRSFRITGVNNYLSLMQSTAANSELNDAFYTRVDAAISAIEGKLN
jgi:hypothetical protein